MLPRLIAWGLLVLIGCYGAISWLHSSTAQAEVPTDLQTLLPDADCKAPCWHTIRPGVSTFKEVNNLVAEWADWQKTAELEWQTEGLTMVLASEALNLIPRQVTLGDWIAWMGAPDYYALYLDVSARTVQPYRQVNIYYEAAQVMLIVHVPFGGRLSPYLPLQSIMYLRFSRPFYYQAWQGFVAIPEKVQFPR